MTPTDVDSLTLASMRARSLTLIGTPSSSAQQLVITVLDPSNKVVATATAAAAGQNTVIENAAAATTGNYTIQIKDAGGSLGLYSIQAYLNSYVKQGTSNLSIGTAQDISGSSYVLGTGNADRLAVVGSLPTGRLQTGDVFVASRGVTNGESSILEINEAGKVVQTIPDQRPALGSPSAGLSFSPYNNKLYVGVTTSDPFSNGLNQVTGELAGVRSRRPASRSARSACRRTSGSTAIPSFYYFYPYAFTPAADGTFWVSQPNSNNIIHIDGSGNVLATYSTGNVQPYSPSVRADGQVYFTGYGPTTASLLAQSGEREHLALRQSAAAPVQRHRRLRAASGRPITTMGPSGSTTRAICCKPSGTLGRIQAQDDGSGNVWVSELRLRRCVPVRRLRQPAAGNSRHRMRRG